MNNSDLAADLAGRIERNEIHPVKAAFTLAERIIDQWCGDTSNSPEEDAALKTAQVVANKKAGHPDYQNTEVSRADLEKAKPRLMDAYHNAQTAIGMARQALREENQEAIDRNFLKWPANNLRVEVGLFSRDYPRTARESLQ